MVVHCYLYINFYTRQFECFFVCFVQNDIGNRPCQETSQPPGLLGGMWSLLDLKNATDNFNERYKVGQGTFGNVYKVNQFNTEYAVKLLNKVGLFTVCKR